MKKQRLILLFLPLVAFLFASFLIFNQAQAGVQHNIRGFASSSDGYISFNCLDQDFFGRFALTFAFYFHIDPLCDFSDFGVDLDDDNNFSGSAWSPYLGYFHFDSVSTPDAPNYDFASSCPNLCNATNDCIACYDNVSQRVFGWAYRSTGNEWISLDSESPPVTMTNSSNFSPGVLAGYASSTSLGRISFSCLTDNTCGEYYYRVYMWKLELEEMSAPNWSFTQACSSGARQVVFEWAKKSGTQMHYRVVVSETNSTSTPVAFDTGQLSGSAQQLACPGPYCAWTPDYGTSYYWWLQLWDEEGVPTELIQFDVNTYGEIRGNEVGNQSSPDPDLTFTTYLHEFPTPFFNWDPPDILVGTTTDFISNAFYYTAVNPNTNAQSCLDPSCNFLWEVSEPGAAEISSTSTATTTILFTNNIPQVVTLSVTDPDDYMCSESSSILTINFQLPLWREVKPK